MVRATRSSVRATGGPKGPHPTPAQPVKRGKARSNKPKGTPRRQPAAFAEPKGWESTYQLIKQMRGDRDAVVDTLGSESLADRNSEPAVFRFQVLVSLLLSSQTKDAVTAEAVANLQRHGLTIENILATHAKVINALIRKVGFHNRKTEYLKKTAKILHDQYNGDVPSTAKELTALPGIGPKMAYIILNVAHGVVDGIGVDTHVHRICNALAWAKGKVPEQTRVTLEAWFPRELWSEVNLLLVGFGQQLQTQQMHLLTKAMHTTDPEAAIGLVLRLGAKLNATHSRPPPEVPAPPHALGATALMYACQHASLAVVRALLQKGALVAPKDANGDSAWQYAQRREGADESEKEELLGLLQQAQERQARSKKAQAELKKAARALARLHSNSGEGDEEEEGEGDEEEDEEEDEEGEGKEERERDEEREREEDGGGEGDDEGKRAAAGSAHHHSNDDGNTRKRTRLQASNARAEGRRTRRRRV